MSSPTPARPPFYPDAPKNRPLTKAQRDQMLTYIAAILHGDKSTWAKYSDTVLVNYYKTALIEAGLKPRPILGQIVPVGPALEVMSTAEFLSKLAAFILNPVRMGELIVGVILIGVGVNAIAKGRPAQAVAGPTRTVVKIASAPQRAARAADSFAAETNRQAARAYATSHARAAGRKAGSNG